MDPTFSDENWISFGIMNGMNDAVSALALDGPGNLYAGGYFTTAGGKGSNYLAKAIINSAPATHFAVTAPAAATVGIPFNFSLTALDQTDNIATGYSGTVNFTSSDTAAVLPANATLTNGTRTFAATLNTAGSRTITATDTVTASITGTSGNITVNAAAALSIAFSGNGNGTVTSTSPDSRINCIKGSSNGCRANYPLNTAVTLAATGNWKSLFIDWSGGLTGSANPVTFTMAANRPVTARFDPNFKVKLIPGDALFASIQDAYASVPSGSMTI
jgi:hypothetical protein